MGAQIASVAEDRSFYVLKFNDDTQLLASMNSVAQMQGVAYVERNGIMGIPPIPEYNDTERSEVGSQAYNPNDPYLLKEWHLHKIMYRMSPAPLTTNVPCIVVFDTGVDYTQPDLTGKVYLGKDTIDADMDPMDANGHGTHVAGIAAGNTNNSVGISGVSPKSNILAVRVLNASGQGTWAQIANGITWANNWATANKCGGQEPKIYNMSLGGTTSSLAVSNAIKAAKTKGRLVIAAAGNNDTTAQFFPAADANALAVGATENNDHRAWFSNHGAWVDIAAPGYKIWSTVIGSNYEEKDGTSMAAPVISGAAARVWSKYPSFTAADVRSKLTSTADPATGFSGGLSRVNLWAALGGGAYKTIQGQIFDAYTSYPLEEATVLVKKEGLTQCTLITDETGFYSCKVPSNGYYAVSASKSGYVKDYRTFLVSGHKFNANIALGTTIGTSASNDWGVVIWWNGFQPYTSLGKEFDLWAVKLTKPPSCVSPLSGLLTHFDPGNDSYLSGQSENIKFYKATGNNVHMYVSLWDGVNWPSSSRLTGSYMKASIYKNNKVVARLVAPNKPTTTTADIWYIGYINTNTNMFVKKNLIKTNSTDPSCIVSPSP